MTLRDLMKLHARTTLTNPDHFGEEVIYHAKAGGGRVVRCVVDRLGRQPALGAVPQIARNRAHVSIPVDEMVGIAVTVPGDRIELAMTLGGARVMTHVRERVSQDEGMFVLEVEQ